MSSCAGVVIRGRFVGVTRRSLLLFAVVSLLSSDAPAFVSAVTPPLGVTVTVDEIPRTVTGRITVSWLPPSSGPPDSYTVTVSPLNFTDALADPIASGFIFSAGGGPSTVSIASPGIAIATHRGHALVANGRGTWPLALRKAPVNATVTATIDCSGVTSPAVGSGGAQPGWLCGLAVYDGGSNATLFIVGLVKRGAVLGAEALTPGFNPGAFTLDGVPLAAAATQTGGGAWGSSGAPVTVTLTRLPATKGWVATVGLVSAPSNAVTLTFLDAALPITGRPVGDDADLWHAATAGGFGGADATTLAASATVISWGMALLVPKSPPPTLLGLRDVCISPFVGVAPVTTTVSGSVTAAYITGLSGTFPYTVSVVATTGSVPSSPSAPLPGVYFFARHMPPRAAALGAWYDSRVFAAWPTSTFPSTWPDSSGRSHDLAQPNRAAPVSPLPTFSGAPTPWSYQRVTFSRARGSFMVGGYDILDLGIGGNFTAYVMSLSQAYTPQVIFGRGGAPASTVTGSTPGYAVAVMPTTFNPAPAWQGIKASDGYSPTVFPGVSNYVAFYGTSNWILQPAIFAFTATTLQTGDAFAPQIVYYTAGRTAPIYQGAPPQWSANAGTVTTGTSAGMVRLPDASGNWTTLGLPGVAWLPTGAAYTGLAGSAPAFSPLGGSPALNAGGAFRIGGPVNGAGPGTGNPTYAFQGDLYQVLLYSETHTPAQQASITQWLRSYTFDSTCGYGLPSTMGMTSTDQSGVASLAGYCSGQYGGILNGGCWQTCAANYGVFTGAIWAHYCTNGQWSGAPLVCRMQCSNAQPPLYASPTLCSRNIVADTLDSNVTTGLTYVTYPAMPQKQLLSTWRWVTPGVGVPAAGPGVNASGGTLGGYIEAAPWFNDTCASMNAGAFSMFGYSPDRWTDRLSSFVPWGTTGNVTVSLQLVGPGAMGGIAVRIVSATSYYRVVLTAGGGGVRLFRSVNGVLTLVPGGSARSNITVYSAPVWHSLSVSYNNAQFNASLDGVRVFSVTDTVTPFLAGAPAMYAAAPWPSLVRFDNLAINGACDAFGQGVSVLAGMNVTHSCLEGYMPIGNATRTCRATPALATAESFTGSGVAITAATLAQFPGSYDSPGLTCVAKPPVFTKNVCATVNAGGELQANASVPYPQSFFPLRDRPLNGTEVGIVYAAAAQPSQVVTYSIVSVTVTSPRNFVYQGSLFSIVACSGVIRVNSSTPYSLLLDSVYIQNVTVLVMAVPDGQTLAAAYANVTVFLIPVPLAPQAQLPDGYVLSVDSGYVGPVTGSFPAGPQPGLETYLYDSGVAVYNHNSLPLEWSIIGGATKYFSINATSGVISTISPGVNYAEAQILSAPGNVTLIIIVQVASLNDPANLFSVINVPIVINEVHQPPFQQDYVFSIALANAVPGQLVGVLYNNAPTLNPDWQPKNMTIITVSTFLTAVNPTVSTDISPFAPLEGSFLQTGQAGPWTSNVVFSSRIPSVPKAGVPFLWPPPSLLQPSAYTSAVYILNVSTADGAGLGATSVYYSQVEVRVLYDNSVINGIAASLIAVIPPPTVPTEGGTIVQIFVSNLPINTVDLNITVGSLGTSKYPNAMGIAECLLCTASGTPIARTPGGSAGYRNTAFMNAAGVLPTLLTEATLYCLLPPGQGAQPLAVFYATPNPVNGIVSMFPLGSRMIYYAAPVVLTASVWVRTPGSAPGSGSGTLGVSVNGTLYAPPSLYGALGGDGGPVRSARIDGFNFGLCPVLTLTSLLTPSPPTVIDTCSPFGVPITAAGVVHSHTFIEFPAPPGIGSGWALKVSVGQPFCSLSLCPDTAGVKTTVPVPWSYEAPVPVAITPNNGGACSSATPVTVTFDFLGPLGTSQLTCTVPGSGTCGAEWVPYAEVDAVVNSFTPVSYTRASSSSVVLTTPSYESLPSPGFPLTASGFVGSNFSFAPPTISQIGFGQWVGSIPATLPVSAFATVVGNITGFQLSPVGAGSILVPPNPDFARDVVFLLGSNLCGTPAASTLVLLQSLDGAQFFTGVVVYCSSSFVALRAPYGVVSSLAVTVQVSLQNSATLFTIVTSPESQLTCYVSRFGCADVTLTPLPEPRAASVCNAAPIARLVLSAAASGILDFRAPLPPPPPYASARLALVMTAAPSLGEIVTLTCSATSGDIAVALALSSEASPLFSVAPLSMSSLELAGLGSGPHAALVFSLLVSVSRLSLNASFSEVMCSLTSRRSSVTLAGGAPAVISRYRPFFSLPPLAVVVLPTSLPLVSDILLELPTPGTFKSSWSSSAVVPLPSSLLAPAKSSCGSVNVSTAWRNRCTVLAAPTALAALALVALAPPVPAVPWVLTLSGAAHLVLVASPRLSFLAGPAFDGTTAVSVGGVPATVNWVSPDGMLLSVTTPLYSALCSASANAGGGCGSRALVVGGAPSADDAAAVLALARIANGSELAASLAAFKQLPGPELVCPPACAADWPSKFAVLTASEVAIFVEQAAATAAATRPMMSSGVSEGVFYVAACSGYVSPESGACSNASSPLSAQCAWGEGDSCQPCPSGALCPGGARMWPRAGFWASSQSALPSELVPCPAPDATSRCPGASSAGTAAGAFPCGAGYRTGTVGCAGCSMSYFPSAGACVPCPADDALFVGYVLPVLVLLFSACAVCLFLTLLVFALVRKKGGSLRVSFLHTLQLVVWLWTALQVLVQVGRSAQAIAPPALAGFFSVLAVLQFQGISLNPACSSQPPFAATWAQFAFLGAAYCVISMHVAFACAASADCCGPKASSRCSRTRGLAERAAALAVRALVVLYALLTNTALTVLTCTPVNTTVRGYVALIGDGSALHAAAHAGLLDDNAGVSTNAVAAFVPGAYTALVSYVEGTLNASALPPTLASVAPALLAVPLTVPVLASDPFVVCYEGAHASVGSAAWAVFALFSLAFPLACATWASVALDTRMRDEQIVGDVTSTRWTSLRMAWLPHLRCTAVAALGTGLTGGWVCRNPCSSALPRGRGALKSLTSRGSTLPFPSAAATVTTNPLRSSGGSGAAPSSSVPPAEGTDAATRHKSSSCAVLQYLSCCKALCSVMLCRRKRAPLLASVEGGTTDVAALTASACALIDATPAAVDGQPLLQALTSAAGTRPSHLLFSQLDQCVLLVLAVPVAFNAQSAGLNGRPFSAQLTLHCSTLAAAIFATLFAAAEVLRVRPFPREFEWKARAKVGIYVVAAGSSVVNFLIWLSTVVSSPELAEAVKGLSLTIVVCAGGLLAFLVAAFFHTLITARADVFSSNSKNGAATVPEQERGAEADESPIPELRTKEEDIMTSEAVAAVSVLTPTSPPWRRVIESGGDSWWACDATGESAWELPPGAVTIEPCEKTHDAAAVIQRAVRRRHEAATRQRAGT